MAINCYHCTFERLKMFSHSNEIITHCCGEAKVHRITLTSLTFLTRAIFVPFQFLPTIDILLLIHAAEIIVLNHKLLVFF